jgi:NadR type nicotinamide-nucleotide adenylyltransferase
VSIGLVVGKFYPPHAGHRYLIETALAACDQVFVALLGDSGETIPLELRATALREMCPAAVVRAAIADHRVDYADPAVYDWWDRAIKDLIGREQVDYLFSSEPAYGDEVARRLGARHVLVDAERQVVPVSGTAVRADPQTFWESLGPTMRAWYVPRICLTGAESTGTTTMARLLARRFRTVWVPEYGRAYSIPKDRAGEVWSHADFWHIALTQAATEDAAARRANRILFADTDPAATALWHAQYLGTPAADIAAFGAGRRYALTFLTADDFAWVDDGSRYSPAVRARMQAEFRELLAHRSEPVRELTGSIKEREAQAVSAIREILGIVPPPSAPPHDRL